MCLTQRTLYSVSDSVSSIGRLLDLNRLPRFANSGTARSCSEINSHKFIKFLCGSRTAGLTFFLFLQSYSFTRCQCHPDFENWSPAGLPLNKRSLDVGNCRYIKYFAHFMKGCDLDTSVLTVHYFSSLKFCIHICYDHVSHKYELLTPIVLFRYCLDHAVYVDDAFQ